MAWATLGSVRPAAIGTLPSPGKVFHGTKISADSALSGTCGCGLQHNARAMAEHRGHLNTDTKEGHTGCTGIIIIIIIQEVGVVFT